MIFQFFPRARVNCNVYIVPGQTKPGAYPLGGDARYLMSSDGATILEKRQLHRSIIESVPKAPSGKVVATVHAHVLTNMPEDTDVYFVLIRKPAMPEFVSAGGNTYKINEDGTITLAK